MTNNDKYFPLEEPDFIVWPTRSRLYHLDPIGIGTPLVECLTSYIVRLAEAHCLRTHTLVSQEIAPRFQNRKLGDPSRHSDLFSKTGASLNGACGTAGEATGILEQLTQRNDLSNLTMLKFDGTLCEQSLVSHRQKWCPACLDSWRSNDQPIYIPLLWNIQGVNWCHVHRQKLRNFCSKCQRGYQYPLHWGSESGRCAWCHCWLGGSQAGLNAESEDDDPPALMQWEKFVAISVADILASASRLIIEPSPKTFSGNMAFILKKHFAGNISAFSRAICRPRVTIRQWTQAVPEIHEGSDQELLNALPVKFTKPELESVLAAGYALGVRPVKLLTEELSESDPISIRSAEDIGQLGINKGLRRHDKYLIKRVLESVAFAEKYEPMSLAGVCKQFKCDSGYVSKTFPELAAEVKRRYAEFLSEMTYQRRFHIERRVRNVILELHGEEIFPSLHEVKLRLKQPNWVREPWVRDFWRIRLGELGYGTETQQATTPVHANEYLSPMTASPANAIQPSCEEILAEFKQNAA